MEPIESSETSAYINTLTPGTYPKEKKLQSKHGESLKSRLILVGHGKHEKFYPSHTLAVIASNSTTVAHEQTKVNTEVLISP